MESRVNYTVVGLFVIVLSIALALMFFWMSTFKHRKTYNTYLVFVKENVTGLEEQSPVRFNGVPVGYVSQIQLDPRNPQLVRLTLKIESNIPITTATVATMLFQGITGILYVGLKADRTDAPLLEAKPGQKYPVIPWQPSLIVQLSQVLPQITKNVQSIGDSVQKLLNQENLTAIHYTLQNLQSFTQTLAANSHRLNQSMKSLNVTLKYTEDASKHFPDIAEQMQNTLKTLGQTARRMDSTTQTIQNTLRAGRYAIENFTDQLLPATQRMILQINQVMTNFKQVSNEMKLNPSILIRGTLPATPGPGER